MCSVVGYVGKKLSRSFVLEGLSRLEYRGYDSAGFSCLDVRSSAIQCHKAAGRLSNLILHCQKKPIDGHIAIGHTRWSTHGKATTVNAHPHTDCTHKISVVHNGIIENHDFLRQQLVKQGHAFSSETDTEVIAHLFEQGLQQGDDLKQAVMKLVLQLEGAFAFIVIMQDNPETMVLVRKRSPLCVGIGDDEMFVASDVLAFADKVDRVCYLPDQTFALVGSSKIELFDFTGNAQAVQVQKIAAAWQDSSKQGHEHFMLKEMYEQKTAIHATVRHLQALGDAVWDSMGTTAENIKALQSISMIGSGTSWHAGRIAQFFFETICKMPARVHLASEMRHMPYFGQAHSMAIAISQSGETADTLEAMRMLQSFAVPTVALSNVASSSMVREADGALLAQAGPEVAVASTKAFSTQMTVLYWLAHRIALQKGYITAEQMLQSEHDLLQAAEHLEHGIELYKQQLVSSLAPLYASFNRYIFLGRNICYPLAMESALKLKEISYIFSQCYPAGELKHGPLALIDEQTPVVIFSCLIPEVYQKLVANAQEVKARGGHIVLFAFDGQDELRQLADTAFMLPRVKPLLEPFALTGIMQYFAYAVAKELGREIDKPRNLAKSVTVE